jgi:hypothetical protein
LESLYACLNAVKSWFDSWLWIPASSYPTLNTTLFVQMFRCLIVLKRLSTFADPDWDKGRLESAANLSSIAESLMANIRGSGGGDGEAFADVFPRMAKLFEAARDRSNSHVSNASTGQPGEGLQTPTADFTADFDDVWIRNILESWDYGFAPTY